MQKHVATRGAAISVDNPHEGATYPYPLLITLADQDEQLVFDLARAVDVHYEDYKTPTRQHRLGYGSAKFQWVVPFHDGAVHYFRSIGVWNDEAQAHNQRLIERQNVLAQAGRRTRPKIQMTSVPHGWSRGRGVDSAGFDPIWR